MCSRDLEIRDIELRKNRGKPNMRFMDRVKQDLNEKNLEVNLAQILEEVDEECRPHLSGKTE